MGFGELHNKYIRDLAAISSVATVRTARILIPGGAASFLTSRFLAIRFVASDVMIAGMATGQPVFQVAAVAGTQWHSMALDGSGLLHAVQWRATKAMETTKVAAAGYY